MVYRQGNLVWRERGGWGCRGIFCSSKMWAGKGGTEIGHANLM